MASPSSKRHTQVNLQKLEYLQKSSSVPDSTTQVNLKRQTDIKEAPGDRSGIFHNQLARPGVRTGLHDLNLPKAVQSGRRAYEYVPMKKVGKL
jgi:hypothetical protein